MLMFGSFGGLRDHMSGVDVAMGADSHCQGLSFYTSRHKLHIKDLC